jgi:hypothetical protein
LLHFKISQSCDKDTAEEVEDIFLLGCDAVSLVEQLESTPPESSAVIFVIISSIAINIDYMVD